MILDCDVHNVAGKSDVDGEPYVHLSLKVYGNPEAISLYRYKVKKETVKLKVVK